MLTLKNKDLNKYFLCDAAGFLKIYHKKVVLPGRVKCGGPEGEIVVGSWLQVEKKANMWHGRGNSGGSWRPAFPRSLYIAAQITEKET